MSVTIYHNPRCSKSRQTLELIREKGIEPEIIEYLETPPSTNKMQQLLNMLDIEPQQIMRKGEAIYKELGLKDSNLNKTELIKTLVENPKLIERPIVTNGNKAALGRPPENVLEIL
ncbi:MAG: arsenate reductase (glutaredoxin) [Gammaproteobacteria bacterium]|nr:MAG: arsenate reductase (glutaredoxin) [Gammaproteobacteria bacterium]